MSRKTRMDVGKPVSWHQIVAVICSSIISAVALTRLGAGLGAVVGIGGAATLAVVAVGTMSPRNTAMAVLCAAAAAAPMTGVEIAWGVPAADALIAVAAVLALFCVRSKRRQYVRNLDRALLLLILGGLVGALAAPGSTASAVQALARLSVSSALLVVAMGRLGADIQWYRRIYACWLGGVVVVALSSRTSVSEFSGRAEGLTTHPNVLGSIAVMGLAAAFYFGRRSRRSGVQWAAALAAGPLVYSVLVSGSRTAVLMLVAMILIWLARALMLGQVRVVASIALAVGGLVIWVFYSQGESLAVDRVLGTGDHIESVEDADAARGELLERGLDRVKRSPLSGQGFQLAERPHNVVIDVAGSAGPLGLAGLAMIGALVAEAMRYSWRPRSPTAELLFVVSSVMVAYGIYSLFQNALWARHIWLHLCLVASLLDADLARNRQEAEADRIDLHAGVAGSQ